MAYDRHALENDTLSFEEVRAQRWMQEHPDFEDDDGDDMDMTMAEGTARDLTSLTTTTATLSQPTSLVELIVVCVRAEVLYDNPTTPPYPAYIATVGRVHA